MTTNAIKLYEESKPKLAKHLGQVKKAMAMAEEMVVDSPESYRLAGERMVGSKERRSFLEGMKAEVCIPLHNIHKVAVAEFAPAIEGWKECERIFNKKMGSFDSEQERIARKRQEELRQLAEVEAAKERAEAEELALKAEAKGDDERAQELREEAAQPMLPVPMIAPAVPTIEGLKSPMAVWHYEILDIDKVPEEFLKPRVENGARIRDEAKRTRGKCVIPGVRVWSETSRSKK